MTSMFSGRRLSGLLAAISPIIGLMLSWTASPADAALTYSYTGGAYTQNFDTLPVQPGVSVNASTVPTIGTITYSMTANGATTPVSFTDTSIGSNGNAIASGMVGWWTAGTVANQFGAHYGDQTKGGVISFGTSGSTNRAIGLMGTSTSGIEEIGMNLVNTTTATLNQITISYTGELWRNTTTAYSLNFGYYLPTSGTGDLVSAVTGQGDCTITHAPTRTCSR